MKVFLWVYIITFMAGDNFAVPQIILGIIMSPTNICIAWKLKPLPMFLCFDLTKVSNYIGVAAMLLLYF